jgi:hypothetical protein
MSQIFFILSDAAHEELKISLKTRQSTFRQILKSWPPSG